MSDQQLFIEPAKAWLRGQDGLGVTAATVLLAHLERLEAICALDQQLDSHAFRPIMGDQVYLTDQFKLVDEDVEQILRDLHLLLNGEEAG